MQGDGSFLLADVAVVVSAVSVGDRLADNADLFALNRNLDGLGLVDNVLAQADLAGLDAVLGDVQLLLGADDLAVVSNVAAVALHEVATVGLNLALASCVASTRSSTGTSSAMTRASCATS